MNEKNSKEARKEAVDTLQDAKKLLQKEQEQRIKLCQEEVNTALKRHNCIIDVCMLVTVKGNIPKISVLSKEN